MRNETLVHATRRTLAAAVVAGTTIGANADVITDWNARADEIVAASKLGTPPAFRVMTVVQTAVHDAVNAVTRPRAGASMGASADAAVAAANRATLASLVPSQAASIDAMYRAALATVADGAEKDAGIAAGERAAAAVLTARADGAAAAETYRPHTTAGVYVPTLVPAASQWPLRKPWLMASADQFRPGPPPALTSPLWARDFNEMRALGGKGSARRSPEQSEIARFWQASLPSVYNGVVRSVALAPGRSVAGNARLFATVAQATDDALIAIMDAKYHYGFWRPVTAIRNGDIDGNDATQRDPSWAPFIDTPMHPEYPCAHCVLSGAVGTVLKAEIGQGSMPILTTTSYTAEGAARSWNNVDDFMTEVANARIYGGMHYRNSTEVGAAIGKQVGQLAAAKHLPPLARLSPAS